MQKRCILILLTCLFLACSKDDPPPAEPVDTGGTPTIDDDGITGFTPCESGLAGAYACNGYDLLGLVPLQVMDAASANDIWGWTDPVGGREYALIGLDNGTAFVDITDTERLTYLGKLPTATGNSPWRDIKVYQNHAFIGSEAPGHGMQVFDLTKLRNIASPPVTFTEDARYTGFGTSHNIVINESTGFAYPVGTARNDLYGGGVHFIDIRDPKNPIAAGGYGAKGYTHDAQVVTYNGPDPDYTGRELFIGSNETQVVLVDVTDKANPVSISSFQYSNLVYTHQGWLTEDQRYYLQGDEQDESNFGFNSRTLVFDLTDLDAPVLHTAYLGPTPAIDHNGYVKGDQFILANYSAGVRVVDISGIAETTLIESGYFDTFPAHDTASYTGVWSVYPYFESGKIIVSDIESGLFIIGKSN